jgi:hypothetical protein
MATLFANLPVPAGNGVGAGVAVGTMGATRTVAVKGTFTGTVTVELSNDGGTTYVPLASFTEVKQRTLEVVAQYMRVRRSGVVAPAGTPNVDVGGDDIGSSFANLPVTAGDGDGAGVDVSALGTFNTVVVSGTFTGSVTIQMSLDNVDWLPVSGFSAPGQKSKRFIARYLRVVRSGVGLVPGTPIVNVGAANDAIGTTGLGGDRVINVAKVGGDASTVAGGITLVLALVPIPSAAAPAVVFVNPGVYSEAPFTVPTGVVLKGIDPTSSIITASTTTAALATLAAGSAIRNITLHGANGVGGIGLLANSAGEALAHLVLTQNCTTGVQVTGAGVSLQFHSSYISMTGAQTGVQVAAAGLIDCYSCKILGDGTAGSVGINGTGVGSNAHVFGTHISSVESAFLSQNGDEVQVSGGNIEDCDYVFHIDATGGTIHAYGVDAHNVGTYNLYIEAANGSFRSSGCVIRSDQMSVAAGASVVFAALSDFAGDRAFLTVGELAVGLPNFPSESIFGEGDSYVRTMAVLRNTNLEIGAWTDISTEMSSSSGSTAAGFSGVGAGNCLYIGGSEKQFPGIKTLTTVAQVVGAGNVDLEYWNGLAWIAIHYMAADSQTPWESHGETIFGRAQSDQVRWPNAADLTGWAQKALNGYTKWWVRFHITVGITSVPTLEQIKLHSNRTEINADGVIEHFGTARTKRAIAWHKRNMLNFTGGGAPGNSNVTYSANITLNGLANVLANNNLDGLGGSFTVPEGLDTSKPLVLQWTWVPVVAPGNPSAVEFQGHFVPILEGSLIDGSLVDDAWNKIVVTTGHAQWEMFKTTYEGDISTLSPGDIVAFSFYRDAQAGNLDDTLAGNVQLLTIEIFGYFWR